MKSAFFAAAALVGACSAPLPPPLPLVPAPPFQYIERPRLQSAMWRLADDVTTLDTLLDDSVEKPPREQVLAALDDMGDAVATLSSLGGVTNHPRLDRELPRFAVDIAEARAAAAHEPPQYLLARALPSACLRCHGR